VNGFGELGLGHTKNDKNMVPTIISAFRETNSKISQIATGAYHNLVKDSAGRVFSWGWNRYGQCGLKKGDFITTPTLIYEGVVDVKCGANHSLVVTEDGKYFLFGRNEHNEVSLRQRRAKKIFELTALNPSLFAERGLKVVNVDLGYECTWISAVEVCAKTANVGIFWSAHGDLTTLDRGTFAKSETDDILYSSQIASCQTPFASSTFCLISIALGAD
jgi:alpha-tubulin suppressor-like RCC1 family protein